MGWMRPARWQFLQSKKCTPGPAAISSDGMAKNSAKANTTTNPLGLMCLLLAFHSLSPSFVICINVFNLSSRMQKKKIVFTFKIQDVISHKSTVISPSHRDATGRNTALPHLQKKQPCNNSPSNFQSLSLYQADFKYHGKFHTVQDMQP